MPININTAAEQVYDELRARIISGDLAPSAPLPLGPLARQLGVSTTPVRVALSRLQTDGLVTYARHRGAMVSSLELEDLEVIQAVRSGVEGAASRLGAPRLDAADVEKMRRALDHLQMIDVGSTDKYLAANWRLRDICYLAANRPQMRECISSYQRRAERYIRLVIRDEVGFRDSLDQQRRFFEACVARDGVQAENVIRDALQYTVERLRAFFADEEVREGGTVGKASPNESFPRADVLATSSAERSDSATEA